MLRTRILCLSTLVEYSSTSRYLVLYAVGERRPIPESSYRGHTANISLRLLGMVMEATYEHRSHPYDVPSVLPRPPRFLVPGRCTKHACKNVVQLFLLVKHLWYQ